MLNEVYGSPAPSKSGHYTEKEPLLSEDDVRQRMSDIARRYDGERQALRDAYAKLAKREAETQLAITFIEPKLLKNLNAKQYLEKAKDGGTKLTVADKEALIMLELETEKVNYDLAKFDCETSDKEYAKLEPQLSFYQSLLKLRKAESPASLALSK